MSEPAVDFDLLTPTDIPEDDEFSIPDHNASRKERRSFLGYLGAKKEDEKPRPRKRRKPAPRAKKGAFVEPLTQMYGFAGVALMMRDPHCGQVVLENAERCAEALDELAYQNESVRRVLDALTTTSAFGMVLMAHAPIIAAVASHHGGGKIPFVPKFVEPEQESA